MIVRKYIYIVQVTRQLSIDIINNFAEKGDEIELITGIVESSYQPLNPKIKVTSLIKYNNTSNSGRLFSSLIFTLFCFFILLFRSKKKELILVTTPPFIIFCGSILKKLFNIKYHLIIWDLYPDVLIKLGTVKEHSFINKLWTKWNKICFSNASTIFTIGHYLSIAIKKYTDKNPIIISNWANSDFVKPTDKKTNQFAIQYNLTDKFTVMYSGNWGLTHNLEAIVLTAEKLKHNSHIQFVIIGDGAKRSIIELMIKEKKLTNILLLPYQDKKTLPASLSSADVAIISLSEGAEDVSVPSKTYSSLSAGSVILALASEKS
ncbi:MAG TPA: glycosyltransferase family 4 protein, partial [Bacteroidia bacterium]|nr:glycosyltransferase family 4 protein [Bacteroidia bacterium]